MAYRHIRNEAADPYALIWQTARPYLERGAITRERVMQIIKAGHSFKQGWEDKICQIIKREAQEGESHLKTMLRKMGLSYSAYYLLRNMLAGERPGYTKVELQKMISPRRILNEVLDELLAKGYVAYINRRYAATAVAIAFKEEMLR